MRARDGPHAPSAADAHTVSPHPQDLFGQGDPVALPLTVTAKPLEGTATLDPTRRADAGGTVQGKLVIRPRIRNTSSSDDVTPYNGAENRVGRDAPWRVK